MIIQSKVCQNITYSMDSGLYSQTCEHAEKNLHIKKETLHLDFQLNSRSLDVLVHGTSSIQLLDKSSTVNLQYC